MARNPGQGPLLADIIADLRSHQRLLDRLAVDDLQGVSAPDDSVQQIHPAQPEEDRDYPVSVWVKLTPGAGEHRGASTSSEFVCDIGLNTRSNWRKAVQQDREVLVAVEMDWLLDLVEERASVNFGAPYITASRAGGASNLQPGGGDQLTNVRRWTITRTVVGNDGPRA
ncbi:hypothetical protein [Haloferax volcanii]|uniref:hypothetical protein n=1 Tax=Haloferax volcanii TaxID=2246 RepID=UPI00249A7393|nr:hypothetical protein [Haloferax alexandrinus]WEL29850.1 hypothetical protein HBNXHx_1744 [Haloferax alexandrinus]